MPLEVTGNRELSASLEAQAARMRAPTPFLELEATTLDRILIGEFEAQRSPNGQAWAPRVTASRDSRTRRARPRRETRPHALLQRTGRLLAGQIVRAIQQGIAAANDVEYAGFVNKGTRFMRAREIMASSSSAGAVGAWFAGFRERLGRYVVTGQV